MNPESPPLLDDWARRFRAVETEVGRMMLNRTVWRGVREMLERNPNFPHPPFVFGVFSEAYLSHQAIRVRRQRDRSEHYQETLGRLLLSIENNAASVSRAWYVSRYARDVPDPFMIEIGEQSFTTLAGGQVDSLPPEWAKSRRERLEDLIRPIGAYVNKRIAHTESRQVDIPSTEALDAAIDAMAAVVNDLALLLLAAGMDSPEPIPQFNWAADLEVPWYVRDPDES